MDSLEMTMDQLGLALGEAAKLGVESGQKLLREQFAAYLDSLAELECFKPNFAAMAQRVRLGEIAPQEKPDLTLVDLSDDKVRNAYRLGMANVQVEIANAINREQVRCQAALRVRAKQENVGLGTRARLIGEIAEWIRPVSNV